MTFFLYGATLAFAWFVGVNVLTSALVSLSAGTVSNRTREAVPATRARILLTLRLLPAATAIVFTLTIFLPSFVRFEPRNFDEVFGLTTLALAVVACAAIVTGIWRGVSALAYVRMRVNASLQHASPLRIGTLKAFRVDVPSAAMSLIGVLKPRLLVAGQLLDLLTREELAVAVAHETSHLRSRDNLKRLAMRSAPDVFAWSRTSWQLEQEWCLAAEHAADARAARDTGSRLALASALIKAARAARFAPGDFTSGISSPLVGGESLRSRVERLLEPPRVPASTADVSSAPNVRALRVRALAFWTVVFAVSVAVAWSYQPVLFVVHDITEVVVHRLP